MIPVDGLDAVVAERFETMRRRVADRLGRPEAMAWLFRGAPPRHWAPDYLTFGTIGRNGVERLVNGTLSRMAPELWYRTLWAKIRKRVMEYGAATYFPRILKDIPETPEIDALRRYTIAAMDDLLQRNWPELRHCTFYEAFDCLAAIMNEARRVAGYAEDSFLPDRAAQNATSLAALGSARALVAAQDDRLDALLRLVCRGNWIDGMEDGVVAAQAAIIAEIEGAGRPAPWLARADAPTYQIGRCRALLAGPSLDILYELDNCGEAVFDLLLVEELLERGHTVSLCVKERPVANDVTRVEIGPLIDAMGSPVLSKAMEDGSLRILTAGVFAAARLLNDVSPAYREAYGRADLVLLKGQGNFQTVPMGRRAGGRFVAYPYAKPVMVLMGVKADLVHMALATAFSSPAALGTPFVFLFDPADPATYPA